MFQDQDPYFLRKQWEKEDRQDRYRIIAGILEFLGVIVGVACIVVLLALLFSLVSWLNQDISSTFAILRTRLR